MGIVWGIFVGVLVFVWMYKSMESRVHTFDTKRDDDKEVRSVRYLVMYPEMIRIYRHINDNRIKSWSLDINGDKANWEETNMACKGKKKKGKK